MAFAARMVQAGARVILCCLSSAAAAGAQPPGPPPPSESQDYSTQAFIIEQARTVYRFENDGTGKRDVYLRVKTQSEAGVQAWGQLVFGYNAASERIDIEFVRVRKADGSVMTAPEDSIQDLTSPVERIAPVYTDFRQKHVTVPSLRPGETVEFRSITTVHTALARGQFWTEYDFRKQGIVLDEQLEIDVPADRKITLKTLPGADPVTKESGGRRIYHWTSSNRKVDPEENADDEEKTDGEDEPVRAAVRLTTFQSWAEVGQWYSALEKSSRTATPEIRKKALELTAGKSTDLTRLEALYDFVAPNFRYVSLSLGMGRYQPRAAGDVLRDQYGDCKDKHTLLASLMESIGLPVSAVLISSRQKLDSDFPSPSQFDHVITRAVADKQTVWLDVTTEVAPFRLLSSNLRKKQALVVSNGVDGYLDETPADPPMTNMQGVEIDAKLGELGRMGGRVRLSFRGDVELFMRSVFRSVPAAQWKMVIDKMNGGAGMGGDVSDWKITDPADTRKPFVIEYQVSKAPLVDWTKKNVDVRLPFTNVNLPSAPEATSTRTSPIELGSPATTEYKLRLELSADYKPRAPLPVSIARDYGEYRGAYTLTGNTFAAERLLTLKAREIPSDRAGDYASFRRVVMADAEQALGVDVIAATAAVPPDLKADELYKSGVDAVRNENYAQAIPLLKRVVELEPKHKSAWNHLGYAHYSLRELQAAIEAFNRQVALNPYDEYAFGYLGRAYRLERRYDEAERAFRKQLEINPLEKWAHGELGSVLLETQRYAEAVPVLERATALSPDSGWFHVQLGTAYLNVDRTDEALASYDKAAKLESTPTTWNNIAYQLSLKGAQLDRAQQLAESAVSSVTAASRTFSIQNVSAREIGIVRSLASYWDTLGWVHFAKGDLARAETLVIASWRLGESAEVGDHLAQIREKQGRRDEAIKQYALALNADRPMQVTRDRLASLAGNRGKAEELVRLHAEELVRQRTVPVDAAAGTKGQGEFVILFGAGGAPESATFVGGDEALRALTPALLKARYGVLFPDDAPAKLLRRGTLTCAAPAKGSQAPACTFVFTSLRDTKPVN
jgi:tetratricopeptide (TPR) repeat protein